MSLQVDSLQLTNQVFDCDLIVQQLGGKKTINVGEVILSNVCLAL